MNPWSVDAWSHSSSEFSTASSMRGERMTIAFRLVSASSDRHVTDAGLPTPASPMPLPHSA